jgi:hypothetical protein
MSRKRSKQSRLTDDYALALKLAREEYIRARPQRSRRPGPGSYKDPIQDALAEDDGTGEYVDTGDKEDLPKKARNRKRIVSQNFLDVSGEFLS